MPSELTYLVSCSGCYNNLVVAVKGLWLGREELAAEERRQVSEGGWSIERDFVVCPGCVEAMAPGIAV
jgi:hypothetical protein